jgi:hypothetical protein
MQTITHRSLLVLAAFLLLGLQPSFAQVGVQLPEVSGDAGESITIPIAIDDVTGENVTSYELSVSYNPDIVSIDSVTVDDATVTPDAPQFNIPSPGELRVSFASAEPLQGGGTLVNVEGSLVGAGTDSLTFNEFTLFDNNANEVPTTLTDGLVTSTGVGVSLPDVQAEAGQTITVPLEVDDLTERDITSYEFTVNFNPDVVSVADVNATNTVTPSDPSFNVPSPGELRVSFATDTALSGGGALLNLELDLTDAGSSPLAFQRFQMFDSEANEIATSTSDGSVEATGVEISIPDVTADAGTMISIPVEVDSLTGRNATSYEFTLPFDESILTVTGVSIDGTLTPSTPEFNVVNGELRVSFATDQPLEGSGTLLNVEGRLSGAGTDSLNIASFQLFDQGGAEIPTTTVGGLLTSNGVPVSLPDVQANVGESIEIPIEVGSLDGRNITSYEFTLPFDASIVDVTGVSEEGSITPSAPQVNIVNGELRVSFASDTPLQGEGTLLNVQAQVVGSGSTPLAFQNFQLFDDQANDVPVMLTPGSVEGTGIVVSLPDVSANVGEDLTLPVSIADVTGENITSYEFVLPYNDSIVDIDSVSFEGTVTPSRPQVNVQNGQISVAFASDQALEGAGTLINLEGTVVGEGEDVLSFDSFNLFDAQANEVPVTLRDGSISTTGLEVRLPNVVTTLDEGSVTLPINVQDLSGRNVTAYEFALPLNPAVVDNVQLSVDGTITPNLPEFSYQNGVLQVAFASSSPLGGEGTLLNVTVDLVGTGDETLTFQNLDLFNDQGNEVPTSPRQGRLAVAGTATQAQLIHNAADPSAESVDIYFGDRRVVDDFTFRTATPFVSVPAGVPFEVGVAPGSSNSVADTLASFPVQFSANQTFTVVANGVLNPANFADNPSGQSTAFDLLVAGNAQQTASVADSVDLRGVHGATDAPAVDIADQEGPLFSGVVYGDISGYVSTTPEVKQLTVTPAGGDTPVAVFEGDLSGLTGQATTVLASGFLDPAANQNGAEFALVLVQPDGEVEILKSNRPPQFTQVPADTTIEPKTTLSETFIAQDPNDDAVTYVLSDAPSGATIDGNSGLFEWTPTLAQSDSTYSIQVSATDSRDTTSVSYSVDVMTGTARAQFIHNAADPAAETVDIYFDGELEIPDFSYREATSFVDVPAGTEINVGVAPGNSSSVSDTLASFPVTFAEDATYTVVANGVLDPTNFADNPSGEEIGFDFFIDATAREEAVSADSVDIRAVHGATDAPVVDIGTTGTVLFDDVVYGDISDYITATPGALRLVVTPGDSDAVVASFQADLSGLSGQTATVLASGFLDPASNQNGPAFALVAVLPDGSVVPFPANQPPAFTSVPTDQTVAPGQTLEAQLTAEDPDGETVTFSLLDGPTGATIDEASGQFSFTPTPSQAGSSFTIAVRASDGAATTDTSFAVAVEELNRDPIQVNINQGFGDETVQTNYRLVGLPGQVDLPIENALTGDQPGDWRAFWDNGAATSQQGLVEFDGSSQFNFRPGRGFWLLAANPWTVSQTFQPVALNDDVNATVPLHDGWNIISNPLGKDINWSAVQSENGISVPLWSWNGSFTQSSTFASAQDGQAYYVLNEGGLNELSVPFFGSSSNAVASNASSDDAQILTLSAKKGDQTLSTVWVGTRPDAKDGRDSYDHFSPPAYFANASLSLDNEKISSRHSLASDVRPSGTDGQTYTVVVDAEPGTSLQMQARGLAELEPDQEVRLYANATGQSFDLQSSPVAQITTQSKRSEYVLVVGKASYVAEQESNLVPQKLQLQQNYPNPFRARTTVEYSLPEQTEVSIEVYDILGRRIRTLADGESQRAGVHTVQWNAQNDLGRPVASGVYLTRLQAGDETRTIKMVVVK